MAAIVLLVTWTVLAQLGPDLAASMYLPILFALRDSDLSLLARSEVLLATLWILGDVMFVCITLRMSLHTTGQALGFGVKRWMIPVFLASVYGISLLLGKNADRIQRLAETYFIPGNLILGIFLPGLACLIGAIRQKIGNIQKHRFRESQR